MINVWSSLGYILQQVLRLWGSIPSDGSPQSECHCSGMSVWLERSLDRLQFCYGERCVDIIGIISCGFSLIAIWSGWRSDGPALALCWVMSWRFPFDSIHRMPRNWYLQSLPNLSELLAGNNWATVTVQPTNSRNTQSWKTERQS